jgi:GntR family transcriptional regulator
MINFRVDRRSGVATYLQLVQQVRRAVRLGRLRPGDQLPTVREAVASLAINPNTVLKAYRELERDGLVRSRPGAGTFIRNDIQAPSGTASPELSTSLARWVRRAASAGLTADDMRALLDDAGQELGVGESAEVAS